MSSIIEKLDLTTILEGVTRKVYEEQAQFEPEARPWDELDATDRRLAKQILLPTIVKVIEVTYPHIRGVVEAELVDERFTQAVAGLDFSDLEDLPEAGGAE